ncbi:MAG TPA: SOS response-associated peptidase [Nitrospirae bacterium]|nr:hypothetical protein BMS3Abin06_01623 [bacterium BMS3Abin06]HDH13405.1 SOS response-associated peptidase [Nitrospirota bacterium]HDZ02180.1 SOS response-associated peptidase [Nitrospirota bacterium]
MTYVLVDLGKNIKHVVSIKKGNPKRQEIFDRKLREVTVKGKEYFISKNVCGRFAGYISIPEIAAEFDADDSSHDLKPSYNITPGEDIAIIIKDGKNRIVQCRWGFIPSWTEDPKMGYKMINARAESVAEKASFRRAFRKHRCLIAANDRLRMFALLAHVNCKPTKAGVSFTWRGVWEYDPVPEPGA